MSYTKKTVSPGNGADYPKQGDTVTISYTGNLYDEQQGHNDFRGNEFDSSRNRGDFQTAIGVGRVIKGWDEGVPTMSLGERAILTIDSESAYGARGFPDVIPPNSKLVFEVHLKGINNKHI